MPNVNDILTVAEALEKSPVAVVRDSCVAVRNRNASCRRCVEACPAGAIEVGGNEISLSASACVGCGACTAVCPTGALVPVEPADAALVETVASAREAAGGRAVFACARIAAKRLADPASYAEVPCLARVDESAMLGAIAAGAESVLLVDGGCSTCKHREAGALADAAVDSARALLAAVGSSAPVERRCGFPDDLLVESVEGKVGSTRRGFFSDAVSAAKDTAMTAAKVTVAQELGIDAASEAAIGERLRVTEDGTLPRIRVPRHEAVMDALDAIGEPGSGEVGSRLFGTLAIDVEKCNKCGMCAMFCAAGALSRYPSAKSGDPLRRLEFQACDCVRCGLCADVCWKDAIELVPRVSAAELFDFEPIAFDLR